MAEPVLIQMDPQGRERGHPDYDPFDDGRDASRSSSTPKEHGFKRFDELQGENLEPEEIRRRLLEEGDPERTGSVDTLAKKKGDHSAVTAATMKYVQRLFESQGFLWVKVECQAVTFGGMQYKRDLLGFMDAQIVKDGRVSAIQVTTEKDAGNHIRSMLHPDTEKRHCGHVRENVLAWLEKGARIFVVGCFKEGKFWSHRLIEVDHALIAQYDSRRRT